MIPKHECLSSDRFPTSITLIGAGGTGSHMVDGLARMHCALRSLGHNGLMVSLFDDDVFEQHNVGRQLMSWKEVGENKAIALIQRVNRTYGTNWKGSMNRFRPNQRGGNIIITAVDCGTTRNIIHDSFKKKSQLGYVEHAAFSETHYWMDLGNDKDYGQVVLAHKTTATAVDLFGRYEEGRAKNSCSTRQSLESQDLFINQAIATAGLSLLWDLFWSRKSERNVIYVNLKSHTTRSAFKPLEQCQLKSSVTSKNSKRKRPKK